MVQLHLSDGFAEKRTRTDKVVCLQRTHLGLYVGTMQQTADGYIGHILAPRHPLFLPNGEGTRKIGFLHSNHQLAYDELALQVAQTAWSGSLGFEATCLDGLGKAVKAKFEMWLIEQICEVRASAIYTAPTQLDKRQAAARRLVPSVAQERTGLLLQHYAERTAAGGQPH